MKRHSLPAATRRWTIACSAVVVLLAGCEPPPVDTVQRGYRGTGMAEVYHPPRLRDAAALNTPPAPSTVPPVTDGPKARDVYQNVKVLGDLPLAQFAAAMVDITNWVAPTQGCTYCHTANFAEDTIYTKVVSRRMLEMTRHINADWKPHVGNAGVSCYTSHRRSGSRRPTAASRSGRSAIASSRTSPRRRSRWRPSRTTRSRPSSKAATTSASSAAVHCHPATGNRPSRPSGPTA
jgi:hypothetical protein